MRCINNRMADYAGELDTTPVVGQEANGVVFSSAEPLLFFPNGRSAMAAILQSLGLTPNDEILVTNSFGGTYVSSCVTCTIFNTCKPSRVLTEATRAIFVIHEYGVPHPGIAPLLATARNRRIPLIEDCAHTLDSRHGGIPVGNRGDFAIYSLPKVLPMPTGGILSGPKASQATPWHDAHISTQLRNQFFDLLPRLNEYTQRRRENFTAVARAFPNFPLLFPLTEGLSPFFVGLITPLASRIRLISPEIGWGATMRSDLLLVPTNPLIAVATLVTAVQAAVAISECQEIPR